MEVLVSQFSKGFSGLALVAALSVAVAGSAQVASTTSAAGETGSALRDTMPDHLISAHVRDGVLTIDGMVAKVQLNYEIERTGYMYFFIPGVGTAVVSMAPLADGVKVPEAFDGDKLVFAVDGHTVELSGEGTLLAKRKGKADIYVRLDHSTVALSRYPRMGYGDTTASPYVWPLSNDSSNKDKVAYVVAPPPTPKNLLPQTASTASPHQ
jgi:hypothetical protein